MLKDKQTETNTQTDATENNTTIAVWVGKIQAFFYTALQTVYRSYHMTPGVCGKFCEFRTPGTLPTRQSGVSPGACQFPTG